MSSDLVPYQSDKGISIKSLVNDLKDEVKFLRSLNRANQNIKHTVNPQIAILNKLIRKYERLL